MKDVKLNKRELNEVTGGLELTIIEPDLSKVGNLAPPSEGDLKLRKENMDIMIGGLKPSYRGVE